MTRYTVEVCTCVFGGSIPNTVQSTIPWYSMPTRATFLTHHPVSTTQQYARSGRASCKKCNAKIGKGDLRVGIVSSHPDWGETTKWQHVECTKLPRAVWLPGGLFCCSYRCCGHL